MPDLLLACPVPDCPGDDGAPYINVGMLSRHLMERHLYNGSKAVSEARRVADATEAARTAPNKETMPTPCSTCGKPGHNALTCSTATATKKPKAAAGGGTRTKPAPVASPDEAAPVNGHLAEQIRALRADVERGQAAERQLAEIRALLGA